MDPSHGAEDPAQPSPAVTPHWPLCWILSQERCLEHSNCNVWESTGMHIFCFVADPASSLLCALLCPLPSPEVLTSATSVKINHGIPEKK